MNRRDFLKTSAVLVIPSIPISSTSSIQELGEVEIRAIERHAFPFLLQSEAQKIADYYRWWRSSYYGGFSQTYQCDNYHWLCGQLTDRSFYHEGMIYSSIHKGSVRIAIQYFGDETHSLDMRISGDKAVILSYSPFDTCILRGTLK